MGDNVNNFIDADDFTFSAFRPDNRIGDSGGLLIARAVDYPFDKYVVKYKHLDLACNEFTWVFP